jgi:hypothetical protein
VSADRELLNVAVSYLAQAQVQHETVGSADGLMGLRAAFPGQNGTFTGLFVPDEVARKVAVYVLAPFQVPEPARPRVAELLVRINYDLGLGRFDMDFGDGELRYFTAIDVTGSTLAPHQLHVMLMSALTTLDGLLPTLRDVAVGGVAPAAALERAVARLD